MRRILFPALLASAALAGASAMAADLPRRSAPVADYYAPPPAFAWQGFYIGINGGFAFSSFQSGATENALGAPDGGVIGGTVGYNYTFAPNFLLGLEADFDFNSSKDGRNPLAGYWGNSSVDNTLTIRARAGVTLDRALIYLTGGFAGSNTTATVGNAYNGFYGQQSKFLPGWALGAGVEFGLAPNLSAKAEYLFTSVGGDRYFDFSPNALSTNLDTSTIRGGLNYHF